jgi:hypothetical protein
MKLGPIRNPTPKAETRFAAPRDHQKMKPHTRRANTLSNFFQGKKIQRDAVKAVFAELREHDLRVAFAGRS